MSSTDLRALGRLGAGTPQPDRRARRAVRRAPGTVTRRGVPKPAAIAALLLVALIAWVWVTGTSQTDPQAALATRPAAPSPSSPDTAASAPLAGEGSVLGAAFREAPETFAEVDGLALGLPHPDTSLAAFHEASRAEALAMTPVGQLLANDNPTKFTAGDDVQGPSYRVLSSRGRPRPATSAADLVLSPGATVTAPVSGTVTELVEYSLYGRVSDWRIVIEPAERPELAVVLIHLEDPAVAVGDAVVAGVTPLATVRQLPFRSHVDDHTDGAAPHVHLEVKPAGSPEPPDPNAPAVDASEAIDADL